jgi:hypothetical protein
MRVEVLKAASMKMTVFWDVAPCSLVETDRCFMKQPECDCTVGFNFIDFLIIYSFTFFQVFRVKFATILFKLSILVHPLESIGINICKNF